MPGNHFRKLIRWVFVICNIIVALLFCIGCYAKLFSSLNGWVVGLFSLSSFFLFIGLLVFFIGWILVRSGWALLFIIIMLIAWKPFTNIIPFRFSSSFTMQKQTNALRVMSWNVESFEILKIKTAPGEKQKMIDLINKYRPDIACFQEMTCADSSKAADYHLQDFIDSLHFPYHYYAYDKTEDYYPGTHTHYGKIIFSRFPIINKQTIKDPPGDYNYTFEYCDIKKGDDTIRVFNIHLQTMKFDDENYHYIDSFSLRSKHDLKESKGIVEKLKASFSKRHEQANNVKAEMNKSPYPVIVCGDFNDVPNSYAYETIGNGLQNAFVKKGVGFGRSFSEILPTLRIDNIFVDQKFSVLQYIRIKKRLSDHYPVITDLLYQSK